MIFFFWVLFHPNLRLTDICHVLLVVNGPCVATATNKITIILKYIYHTKQAKARWWPINQNYTREKYNLTHARCTSKTTITVP